MNSWFVSSKGEGLSATLGGISIFGLASLVETLAAQLGHPIPADSVYEIIVTICKLIGEACTAFGLLRKAFFKLSARLAEA